MENMPREHTNRVSRETFYNRFIPTDQSLYAENPNTDDCQDDDGAVAVPFGLDSPDMQLSMVYWM